jgi:microcystin-dependent protein
MSRTRNRLLIATSLIGAFASAPASANCGDTPMLGSICIVAFNFCPRGFADASGQILSISQNTALFALLGTQYGGNGQTTFALPDLRGRVPVGVGQGPGLSPIVEGQMSGQENITLTQGQMPAHTHGAQLRGTASNGNTDSPAGAVPAKLPRSNIYSSGGAGDAMGASALTIATAGGSQPVNVRNPYLGLRYCIALEGIFPSRN